MSKIKEITSYLDQYAPRAYQEPYDNAGFLVGDIHQELKGALIALDVTEEVVEDAIQNNCNLIIAHHPVIFRGLKKLTGGNYVERSIIKAIKHDIGVYATHTNLDNVHHGVNHKIGEKLGLKNMKILSPKTDTLGKLTTFIPTKDTEKVMQEIFQAGAGQVGNYSNCSFRVAGTGTFLPNDQANPHIGKPGELEAVTEDRVEVIFPIHLKNQVLTALKKAHPYEEVAYYIHSLINENQETGSGMIGELEKELTEQQFLSYLKEKMKLKTVKHTPLPHRKIKKVAVCGGSGSFLLSTAKHKGADVFVSADFKYHEYFDAEGEILIADIGHYESEIFTNELIYEILSKKFPNIALRFTRVNTNPILYN